jgi:hypothetical protein
MHAGRPVGRRQPPGSAEIELERGRITWPHHDASVPPSDWAAGWIRGEARLARIGAIGRHVTERWVRLLVAVLLVMIGLTGLLVGV